VNGPAAARRLLASVRLASDVDEALVKVRTLTLGESVITPTGEWIGADCTRWVGADEAQHGVLARERELQGLREDIDVLTRQEQD
ncbi:hypothetical protein, partial [Vibrio parahaemolyticus]|uniref:hypothetical protein n=1 Tax=Vibrio parahaemolyticus TaxID=670 RepID=UPI0021138082